MQQNLKLNPLDCQHRSAAQPHPPHHEHSVSYVYIWLAKNRNIIFWSGISINRVLYAV